MCHFKVPSRHTKQGLNGLDLLRESLVVTFSKNYKKFATKVLCLFFHLFLKYRNINKFIEKLHKKL